MHTDSVQNMTVLSIVKEYETFFKQQTTNCKSSGVKCSFPKMQAEETR